MILYHFLIGRNTVNQTFSEDWYNGIVVLHFKLNTVFLFLKFTYKLLHTESLHAHRNSKTLTRLKF